LPRRILLALVPALLAALTAPAARAAGENSGEGTIGIRLAEIPASRIDDPRARAYIVDHVNPGTTIKRRLEIVSGSSRPLRARVYAGAADIGKGGFRFAPEGAANELTSWIRLDRTEVALKPHGRETVRATITVPENAAKGERYAVVWAQVSSGAPGPQGNVALVNRVGVRAYLDVGPGGDPPTDFEIGRIVPQRAPDGQPRVAVKVSNTGERAIDLDGRISLSEGPSSLSAGPFQVSRGTTLAPGDSGEVVAVLGRELPDGPWRYHLTLHSGQVERTATGRLTFPARPGTWGLPASVEHSPLGIGAMIAGVLTGAAATVVFGRRRSATRRRRA
jgi:hypothetical protein